MKNDKTGVWLVGASGTISALTQTGALLLSKKLIPSTGLVTETELFHGTPLPKFSELVFGGCDVARPDYPGTLERVSKISPALAQHRKAALPFLAQNARRVVKGVSTAYSGSDRDKIAYLRAELRKFKKANRLSRVVVVNVADTEPPAAKSLHRLSAAHLESIIAKKKSTGLPASSLYALAAIYEKCAYINFTPSTGSSLPAICEIALREGAPHMGVDGKTGETLIKSHLATMFKMRNLPIESWVGYNILGTRDGKNLDVPDNKRSKINTKHGILAKVLGYEPFTKVGIDFVPPLNEWKIAWDHIMFKGFFETEMSMQFVWQGRDSALAVPLVLDLVRLASLSLARGEKGLLPHLAAFFKSPQGETPQSFEEQNALLRRYITQCACVSCKAPKKGARKRGGFFSDSVI